MADSCSIPASKRVEVDIPHSFEAWLQERASAFKTADCPVTGAAACYQFQDTCVSSSNLELHHITVCDVPLHFTVFGRSWTPNSGSHRIVADIHYRGEPFVIVMEEEENIQCGFEANLIYIGAMTAAGREMADEKSFTFNLVTQIILTATGILPEIEGTRLVPEFDFRAMKTEREPPRLRKVDSFKFSLVDGDALSRQGCTLSAAARHCFLLRRED